MAMDDTWPRKQMLPSLFKTEPAQITLRPLLTPGLHYSPLLRAPSDLHHHQQHQQHQQQQYRQQQHQPPSLLPRSASMYSSHYEHTHAHAATPVYQRDAVAIKAEPETTISYDYRNYQHHSHTHSQQQQQQPPRTSLPVLADMLRAPRPELAQYEVRTSSPPLGASVATTPKSALSFILGGPQTTAATTAEFEPQEQCDAFRVSTSSASSFMSEDDELMMNRYIDQHQHDTMGLVAHPTPRESELQRLKVASKRRAARPASRTCKFEGCDQYVVDHGLCVRHGGGKRCLTEGCSSRAKHFGRCWRHGGSMECKITGCVNRAKSRGFCWSHGGGTKCKAEPCEKIAISNGLCWAHGGGKRCIVEGCMKQAYERTQNYCNSHYQQSKHDDHTLPLRPQQQQQ